jgi:putative transposase
MKKSKFTEAQIIFALKQSETGVAVTEVCRKMGISEATFYNWKKKYGGLGVSELRKLRQLEEENRHLKQLVADLSLDKQMLQDVLKKKVLRPAQLKVLAMSLLIDYRVSIHRACRVVMFHRSAWYYKRKGEKEIFCCVPGCERSPRRGYATGCGGSTRCCGGKAGLTITSGFTAFISWKA